MTYRIRALRNGQCTVAGHHAFQGGDPDERYVFALYVWLIEGGEAPILVEAGLANVEEMNRGAAHVLAEPIVQPPEERTVAQLASCGVRPEDVGWVFITHLHFDHVDQLDLYRSARIVVSRRGLEAATAFDGWQGTWAPGKTLEGLTDLWADRVVAVDDAEVLPGIRTIWLGGHTPCSQAVIVETALGSVAIAGDTVALLAQLERDVPMGIADSHEQCREAMARLREEVDVVLGGHDPNVFDRFPGGVIG
jgi:N-acyl homoserine lactone hydrolase